MNAPVQAPSGPAAEPMGAALLAPEWERVEWLCHGLLRSRRGADLNEEELGRLGRLQERVRHARRPGGPWDRAGFGGLNMMEYDLLACVLAPELEPRIGWLYQDLQQGPARPYPSRALLQELLALEPHAANEMHFALAPEAVLRRMRLIRVDSENLYEPLEPETGVAARLMNRPATEPPPPGAAAVDLRADWEDLILPPDRLAMLREYLLWVKHRRTVTRDWGGSVPGGPIGLFAGASGTGKTFAAAVIAQALGWRLYRVDLGRLVSKYIGETEKNLNALFDAAHGRPMVLQFDEADSLFGKRGEVKEARDRYANMEVSHLLARIEAHDGPCILTTNLRKHLDAAFARRFQAVIEFPRPDAAARAALWARLLPPKAPRAKELDPAVIAKAAPLSGGQIRNAALHAAFLAAEDEKPIDRIHIAVAVWRELAKDGRELSRADLGVLANDLPEGL